MAADVRVRLNSRGVREVLNSKEIRSDLYRRAQAIAERAGTTPVDEETGEPAHDFAVRNGRSRARASVWTATPQAMQSELTDRTLSSALDAGRGKAF